LVGKLPYSFCKRCRPENWFIGNESRDMQYQCGERIGDMSTV
jgi:hypothetical protein